MAKRSSGCGCVALGCVIVLVVGVVAAVLMVGGVGFAITHAGTADPAKVESLAEKICRVQIPSTLEPVGAIDLWFLRAAAFRTRDNVRPPAVIYLLDTPLDAREVLTGLSAGFETETLDRLGITNTTTRVVQNREIATIPFEGTNTLTHYQRTVRLEDQDSIMIVHQAIFRAHGRTGMAVCMLFDVDPDGDTGPSFIRSIRPPAPHAAP